MASIQLARANGDVVRLPNARRDRHMHVLGISGVGKSFFLEHLIRQDIIAGHGVCVIDPHGTLYDSLVQWIASERLERVRTIHLLNPSDETYTFGFNPLCMDNGTRLEFRVDAMVDACVKVWGGTELSDTPRLAKCLTAVFHALAANKLSLAEARFLTNTHHRVEANRLVRNIKNPEFRALWTELLTAYDERTFAEYFESTTSRLLPFVGKPVVREIVGQTDKLIDFRRAMDRGEIVLVNLRKGGQISASDAKLLGALITNDLYTTAFSRELKTAERRPFYFFVDECAQFITQDIVNALDETRKFGLHMVLSHQRINQLTEYGENFYNAVMAGAQLKVMFRAGDDETADIMSRHFFRTSFDLELPKRSMDKPFTVGHELAWFENRSTTHSFADGSGSGAASGTGINTGLSQLRDNNGNPIGGYVSIDSQSSTDLTSSNRFRAEASADSEGASQGLQPTIEFLPTELYKLDELIHLGMVELLSLPDRTAFVTAPGTEPFKIETIEVKAGPLLPKFLPRRVTAMNEASPAVSLRQDVRDRMEIRAFHIECHEPAVADEDGTG